MTSEEWFSVLMVPVEQASLTLEALQDVVLTKQALIECMKRYHLYTAHLEREIEQIQSEIERQVVL